MTETPQPNETPEGTGQNTEGEAPAPTFRPYVPVGDPPMRSRLPLILGCLGVVVLIAGLAIWIGAPEEAEAKPAKVSVRKMTAGQLADNAGFDAARELVRRMLHGTPAEHAAASAVMNPPRSPRLARNLAMAMALEQQKRANAMNLRVQREMQRAEEGY